VRGPKRIVKTGKTPMLEAVEAASRASYDRVIAALNGATWGSVPIVVT
jgi:hypothetical protein